MAVMKSAVSRMSEKGVLAKIDTTATSGSDSLLARFLTRIEPVLSLSTAAWLHPRFSSRVAMVELSDGPEQIPYGCSSVSPSVVQAMTDLGQADATGSEAGQEGFDLVDKGREEELSESPNGESGESAGDEAMANMKDTPEYQIGEMASDIRHLNKSVDALGENLQDLRGVVTQGFNDLITGQSKKMQDDQSARIGAWRAFWISAIGGSFAGVVGALAAAYFTGTFSVGAG